MTSPSLLPPKKVAFFTLGCKLNFAETSHIGKQLIEAGYLKARSGEEADICIVNTCTVTDTADRKCRQAIHRLHREYPHAIMIVTGCYAQLKPQEIADIEGVNLVLGSNEKFNILEYLQTFENQNNSQIFHSKQQELKTFHPSCSYEDRTRYFLKIQDGCDYYCTYCTIPFARGRSRNGSISEITTLAEKAISEGAKEIVLTGVNVGDFGKSTSESFFNLLKALDELPYEIRFRISSIEPDLLSDEIIKWIAQSRHFMPHFHIPLQSGSNEILRIMRRRYNSELFASKIDTIKKWMPDAFIGVDVIVGVRGETKKLFEETKNFISSLNISQLHVFTYSERQSTKMLEIKEIVPSSERKRRSEILHQLSDEKIKIFYEQQIGKPAQVLWENRRKGEKMLGFTQNYVKVEKNYDKKSVNTIQNIILGSWNREHTALQAVAF